MIDGILLAALVAAVTALLVLPLAVCEIIRLGRKNRDLAERNVAQAMALSRAPAREEGGWIIASADGKRFRMWETGWPRWTEDRSAATRYARRQDAEEVHSEDEDAWRVMPYEQLSEVDRERIVRDDIGYST